jgi:hypothetical protein
MPRFVDLIRCATAATTLPHAASRDAVEINAAARILFCCGVATYLHRHALVVQKTMREEEKVA